MAKLRQNIQLLDAQLPERASRDSGRADIPHIPHEGKNSLPSCGPVIRHLLSDHTPLRDYKQIPEARAAVDKAFAKLEKIPAWDVNCGNAR